MRQAPPLQATPAPAESQLGEVLDFLRLLWAVDHGLQSASKRMAKSYGITGPQRLVIRMVGRFPGISAGELANVMCVHPSTLTGVLRRLERRGLLKRRTDPRDGRRALFDLSPAGKRLNTLRSGTLEAIVRRALSRIPGTKLASARDVLDALIAALEKQTA